MIATTTPSISRRPVSTRRGLHLAVAFRFVLLVGLLGLTAWTATRSDVLDEARASYDRSHYPNALRLAMDHLGRRPWSHEAARLAGLCLSRLDFPDQAEPHYHRAGRLALDDLHVRAYAFVRSNDAGRAREAYATILRRWPDDPTALRRLSVVEMTHGNMQEAIRLAERLARGPDRDDAIIGSTMVGSYHHNLGDHERAVSAFDRVMELAPDLKGVPLPHRQFLTHYAQGLIGVGQADRAEEMIHRALGDASDDAELRNLLGQAHHLRGEWDDAERAYARAVELDPNSVAARANLGRARLARGDAEGAVAALQGALDRQPSHSTALYCLILAYRRLGRDAEAEDLHDRLEELRRRQGVPTTGMVGPQPSHMP